MGLEALKGFSKPMSAPCIYHDEFESIALCPGCDFGVCQKCMDDGAEGVCSTCAEERAFRKENSAVQRAYEVAEAVARCNYCRVASSDEAPLDAHGYCEACQALPRCTTHSDLIAVGHCKGCRQEYCRKCLGFTDVCQDCTAKQKVKPKKPAPAGAEPAGARKGASRGQAPAGARKRTAPLGAEPGAGPAGKRKRPAGAGKPSGKAEAGEDGVKKKPKPSRGEAALQEKLKGERSPLNVVIASVAGALVLLVLFSGMFLSAQSPEAQAKRIRQEMQLVHQAVMHYERKVGRLPAQPDEIKRALADMRAPNHKKIRIGLSPAEAPGGVVYARVGNRGFMITGADSDGNSLRDASGAVLYLNQSSAVP